MALTDRVYDCKFAIDYIPVCSGISGYMEETYVVIT